MRRRSLLAGLAASLSVPALAAQVPARRQFFVQAIIDMPANAILEEEEVPGRAELTSDGAFAGCALASFNVFRDANGLSFYLARMSIGFLVMASDKSEIKLQLYDGLLRLGQPRLIITEIEK
jgi:hypothetical protein